MKTLIQGLSSIVVIFLLVSCQNKSREEQTLTVNISTSALLSSNQTNPDKAEDLAKNAELLTLTPGTFVEGVQMAKLALGIDPKNVRAGYIVALGTPLILVKGIYGRIKHFAEAHPKSMSGYFKTVAGLPLESKPAVVKYMTEGPADLNSEKELQKLLDDLIGSFEKIRQFAQSNKAAELTVKASSLLFPKMNERYAMACQIKPLETGEYQLTCPESRVRREITLNRADFDLLDIMASFFIAYGNLVNSYDLTGMQDVLEKYADQISQESIGSMALVSDMMIQPAFGILRNKKNFMRLRGEMKDFLASIDFVIDNQAIFCGLGDENAGRNRIGMLFNTGLCLPAGMKSYLEPLKATVEGPNETTIGTESKNYTTQLDHFKLSDNPVSDLRKLGPFKMDACGNLEGSADPYFGGLFPKGDGNTYWPYSHRPCGK